MLFYHLPRAYAPGESLPHVVGGGADAGRRSERNVRTVVVVVGKAAATRGGQTAVTGGVATASVRNRSPCGEELCWHSWSRTSREVR